MRIQDILYNAVVYCKDLKVGMTLIEEDNPDDLDNSRCCVYIVTSVKVTDEKVFVSTEIADFERKRPFHFDGFDYEFNRKPEEPTCTLFFSSIEEGLKFGLKREDIEVT